MAVGFHPVWFYGLAFAIAWVAWAPLVMQTRGMVELPVPYPVALFVCQTLGAFAPLLSLVALRRIFREPGLVEGVLRKVRLRGGAWPWLVGAAVLPSVIAVLAAVVHGWVAADGEITILRPEPKAELGWALVLVIPVTFVAALVGSPLGEEPGWRGYVLDGFARRSRAWTGSAVVAVLWWVWHVPLFVVLGVAPNGYSFLEMVGFSLLIDSFFLLSGGNLLVAMFAHQGVNIGFLFFAGQTKTLAGLIVLLAVAFALRGWAGSKPQAASG
jgi:membrane protease YdiL (CAAX protease family)